MLLKDRPVPRTRFLSKLILISVLFLAGCKTSEERAEGYFQSGLTLLEAGDVDRALVELRNVFALNPRHKAARLVYADAQRDRGLLTDAYGQYLAVLDQYPDTPEALIALSEIAILANSWDDAEIHGRAAADLLPADPRVKVITAMLDYRAAVMTEDVAATAAPVATARQALLDDPASVIARKIVIDHDINAGDIPEAIALIKDGLALDPDQLDMHVIRLGLLDSSGDTAGVQAALEEMSVQFPENLQVREMLITWYVEQDNLSAAEAYLRRLASAPDATIDQKITVVDFLSQTQGPDAAKLELEKLIASEEDNGRYRVLRATILFTQGQRDAAITEMEAIVAGAVTSDQARDSKIVLAQMLEANGDNARARAYVSEVIAEDPGHVEALKMSAQWLIAADTPDEAILALRQALAQAPRDIGVITLLGQAYERSGDHDLAGQQYAMAVDISNQRAEESLRYAKFLLARDRVDAADAVLANALTVAPQDVQLLVSMAEIQLSKSEWNRVTRIIRQLRALGTESANGLAAAVEVELLNRQQRFEETMVLLEGMIANGETSIAAKAQLIEAQVRANHLDEAREFLATQLAATPDDPTLRFLQAGLFVLAGDADAAEAGYRALIAEAPENQEALQALYALLATQNRFDEADKILDAAIEANPNATTPRLMKAARLEIIGDFEGAIAIYESLYAQDSGNLVVANNLASMLASHREDSASIASAYAIAARLRGTEVPEFQDTIGWISYRRGNYEEALSYLEPAAGNLTNDALTQYHLGMTYLSLERHAAARETLTRAIALGGDSGLPQLENARRVLAELPSE